MSDEIFVKTFVSIDRILDLYEKLKSIEAKGSEEVIFRGLLSDLRDELNRLPNLIALLGNIRAANAVKIKVDEVNYWTNFILGISPINVKKSSSLLMGSGGLSEFVTGLEALREVLKQAKSSRYHTR